MSESSSNQPRTLRSLIDNPWIILALLFLVTAALGLPLLWMSRAFNTTAKVIITVLVVVYTGFILWGFWMIMVWCYQRIMGAF